LGVGNWMRSGICHTAPNCFIWLDPCSPWPIGFRSP